MRIAAGHLADWLTLAMMLGLAFVLAGRSIEGRLRGPMSVHGADHHPGAPIRPRVRRAAEDPAVCRNIMTQGAISFQDIPDRREDDFCELKGALVVTGGVAPLKPGGAVMACEEGLAYALWERQIVQPAAREVLGSPVVSMDHYGAYVCRTRYGQKGLPPSEHATGNAVDIGAFHLADGRVISVETSWASPGSEGVFLRRVRDGACKVFNGVLSPDYNASHHNHLHLDMGEWVMCR